MDFLLEKLRHNMAELSVQGDDFTRRICQLYITFEEFLEKQKFAEHPDVFLDTSSLSNVSEPKNAHNSSFSIDRTVRPNTRTEFDSYYSDSADVSVYSAPVTNTAVSMEDHFKDKAPAKSPVLTSSLPCHRKCRYKTGHRRDYDGRRPLRTVKSARSFQQSGESNYSEVSKNFPNSDTSELASSRIYSDGEKDSALCYVGTNSVDSGYKSSCPTPELSESAVLESKLNVADRQSCSRSRILMGTKVINRQSYNADRNLKQLLYLRQSIIIAMQRYEQQKSKSCPSPSFRPRSLSASTSGYQYGKRRMSHQARPLISSYPSTRTQSPSYNPRPYSTEKTADPIKCDYFALPYSHTSTTEGKYWYSSLANLRMQQERNSWRSFSRNDSSSEPLTSPISPQTAGVSEVAKCMLEIVEDLRNQYYSHGDKDETNSVGTAGLKPAGVLRSVQQNPGSIASSSSSCLTAKREVASKPSEQDRLSTSSADCHVYEEIIYDFTSSHQGIRKPPPLPRRPDSILFNTCYKKYSPHTDARQNYFPKQKPLFSPQ